MKQKRGQFFLIAAIVIIVITVSVLTITNYTQSSDITAIEDLGEEMDIESNLVLDYGASQNKTHEEMDTLMEIFIDNYIDSLEQQRNVYFIFGDLNETHFKGYQGADLENVCIIFNGGAECVEVQISTSTERITQNFTLPEGINNVSLQIEEFSYPYTLLPAGQNFYFVIWENEEGEKKVVVSE
jgi:hypothetical protein